MTVTPPVPAYGGGAMIGRQVRRLRDGATGVVRQQRFRSLLVWVPDQRRNLTFRNGTYERIED